MESLIEKLKAELDELRKTYSIQSHIQCRICGKWFGSLASHLRRHSVTGADYKKEYDVLTVTSDETRQKMTRGKTAIAKAEEIWLMKHWNNDISNERQARDVLGVNKGQFIIWCKILGLVIHRKARRNNWTKAELIAGIQERARKGLPLNYKAIFQENFALLSGIMKHFGSYAQAIQAAGLDYGKIKIRCWSPELVIKTLQERARKGLSLNTKSVMKENHPLYDAARRHFRSYAQAIKSAGFDYGKIQIRKLGGT